MLGSYILVCLTMWIVARFSPLEWREPELCDACLLETYCNNPQCEDHICTCLLEINNDKEQIIYNNHVDTFPPEPLLEYQNSIILGVLLNEFTMGNSFWFGVGTLMQQGSGLNPKVYYFRCAFP